MVEKSFWTPLIFIFYVLNHFTQSQVFSLNVCQKCFLCFKKCGCIRATQTNRNYFAVYRQKRKLNSRSSLEVLQRTSSELDGTTAHVQHVAQQKLPTALVTHLHRNKALHKSMRCPNTFFHQPFQTEMCVDEQHHRCCSTTF